MQDPRPSTSEPRPIKKLAEALINKIAAGEIIHRPASALKELIENSLDAGATAIKITVKDGGLKILQIQDNGCGIRRVDLPILAERFTTSKLSTFSDLSRITTYGFRGEALASISHVAHLSIVTKTKSEPHAWKASYADSVLVDAKTGEPAEAKPCAGNDGTILTIEDLFYNTPTRLTALRSTSEEYARILDVVTKYAVHNPKVSFSCKKSGSSSSDLSAPSSTDTAQSIRLLYGHALSKELLHATASSKGPQKDGDAMDEDIEEPRDDPEAWKAESYFTSPNYQAKKTVFLLFINHRLVESARIKRALEAIYQGILPKGASPFIYLRYPGFTNSLPPLTEYLRSLQIDPRSVDVNVHPTKREVHFLNEEMITGRIADAMQTTLAQQSSSRTFEYQTLLTGGIAESKTLSVKKRKKTSDEDMDEDEDQEDTSSLVVDAKKKVYSQHKVRTSLNDRTLDSMFPVLNDSQLGSSTAKDASSPSAGASKSRGIKESECFLTSVKNLRHQIHKGKHRQLAEIFEKHIFVGIVDLERCLSLMQFSTKLYMVNHAALAEELFYQLGLRQFGDLGKIKLEPPPSLREMVKIAVDVEKSVEDSKLTKEQIVNRITKLLLDRREMLAEYFSMSISEDGRLETIPLLLKDYVPNLDGLPGFLMRLGPRVDWTQETECFHNFLRELAYFYVPIPTPDLDATEQTDKTRHKSEAWQLQHILFPAIRRYLIPPNSLLDRDVVQIASLPDLYKIFERC